MGMSAGQARLLSITSRLTDNELKSQMITNSKLRLAQKSSNVSQEYLDALDSQKLVYSIYDDNGDRSYTSLTANTILAFGDMKNQYSLVNSSGQILVSNTDVKNYKKSNSLSEFLDKYNVNKVKNDEYLSLIANAFGENNTNLYNELSPRYLFDGLTSGETSVLSIFPDEDIEGVDINNFIINSKDGAALELHEFNNEYIQEAESAILGWKINCGIGGLDNLNGAFGTYVNTVSNFPRPVLPEKPEKLLEEPVPPNPPEEFTLQEPTKPEPSSYTIKMADLLKNNFSSCCNSTTGNVNGADHIEHILAHFLESGKSYKTSDGIRFTIKNDADGKTSVTGSDETWTEENEENLKNFRDNVLNNSQNKILQSIIDLYYASVLIKGDLSDIGISDAASGVLLPKTENDKQADKANLEAYEAAIEAYKAKIEEFEKDIENKTINYNEKLREFEDKKSNYDIAKDMYEAAKEKYDSYAGSDDDPNKIALKTAMDSLKAEMEAAESEKNIAENLMNCAKDILDKAGIEMNTYMQDNDITALEEALDNAKEEIEKNTVLTSKVDDNANDRLMIAMETIMSALSEFTYSRSYNEDMARYEINKVSYDRAKAEHDRKVAKYNSDLIEYNKNLEKFNNWDSIVATYNSDLEHAVTNWISKFSDWKKNINIAKGNWEAAIDCIAEEQAMVFDKKDPKYQWYTNLWYRMGGGATGKDLYKEIDANLLNNSEWLQFCFKQGILTLEQAKFSAEGSTKYPQMGTYDWVSIPYTNSPDFVEKDDEVAIARAEVEYKKALTEIENEDKKYDQDLKKLDTEHNALQTEYESIKETISKNVERSFKAFS